MQIANAEVIPVELPLRQQVHLANQPPIESIRVIFIRLETLDGYNAWGCTVGEPSQSVERFDSIVQACQAGADLAPDLHPIDLEYSLAELTPLFEDYPEALCAFDLAFHDLLGLAAGMPLHRLLGGYRSRVQISATVPVCDVQESVEFAKKRIGQGFRMIKIKGGISPEDDVARVRAIHRALPGIVIRLDVDGGYSVHEALEVTRILKGKIEMLEQPTAFDDYDALRIVTNQSPVPILADQSVSGPDSALVLTAGKYVNGLSVKIAACGGLRCSRLVDSIARAGKLATMVNCVIEPALMSAAGLSFALSSPNIQYSDLDGFLNLLDDPSQQSFHLKEGWLVASDVPGLGCSVDLGG